FRFLYQHFSYRTVHSLFLSSVALMPVLFHFAGGPVLRFALKRIPVIFWWIQRLFDRACRHPSHKVHLCARLIISARCPRSAEPLVTTLRTGRLVIDVRVACCVYQLLCSQVNGITIFSYD